MTESTVDEVPETMRAAVLSEPGGRLRIEEIRTPVPGPGEVLVAVTACGVCHTDLHVIKGEVGFPTPAVLGHEISGVIAGFGEGVSERLALHVGARVVGAFVMPCGDCRHCAAGRDDLCETFFAQNRLAGTLYDGRTRLYRQDGTPLAMYSMGGLAEYAVLPASSVTPLPDPLPLESSAILGCAVLTAYGAVRRAADLRVGETVAVIAMGGVGSNIVQIADRFGAAEVIAVDIDKSKLDSARKLGATAVVNGAETDPVAAVRALTGGDGVDVAFEALGTPATFAQAAAMLCDGGRMVAVGIADGTATAPIEITRLVRRSQRIIGSYGARTRTDLPEVVALAARGALSPAETVTREYSLDEVAEAYGALSEGAISGRAVVLI